MPTWTLDGRSLFTNINTLKHRSLHSSLLPHPFLIWLFSHFLVLFSNGVARRFDAASERTRAASLVRRWFTAERGAREKQDEEKTRNHVHNQWDQRSFRSEPGDGQGAYMQPESVLSNPWSSSATIGEIVWKDAHHNNLASPCPALSRSLSLLHAYALEREPYYCCQPAA